MPPQYKKLDSSNGQIRLIRFLRNGSTPPELSLETISKDDNVEYYCLSYMWGDPTPTWPVVVDGARVLVAQNLGNALQRLDAEECVHLLWVDALCINQCDDIEKQQQIPLMGEIFGNAVAVFAWLGPETVFSREVMDEIVRVGDIFVSELIRGLPFQGNEDNVAAASNLKSHESVVGMMIPLADFINNESRVLLTSMKVGWTTQENLPSVEAFTEFFSRPYWKRTWILQELATAKDVYLLCGCQKKPFWALLAFLSYFTFLRRIPTPMRVVKWSNQVVYVWAKNAPVLLFLYHRTLNILNIEREADMLALVRQCGEMEVSIPQDRVFALLAIARDEARLGVDINYSISLQRHLENITKDIFLRRGIKLGEMNTLDCPWACGCPTWVAPPSRAMGDFFSRAQFLFYEKAIGREVSETGSMATRFQAHGNTLPGVSQDAFPAPGILKVACYSVGELSLGEPLLPAGEKEEIAIASSQVSGAYFDLSSLSFLKAAYMLKKLNSFVNSEDLAAKLADPANKKNEYPLWGLLIRHGNHYLGEADSALQDEMLQVGFRKLQKYLKDRGERGVIPETSPRDNATWEQLTGMSYKELLYATFACLTLHSTAGEGSLSVFWTSTEYIGIFGGSIQMGDRLIIISGVKMPYIVRPIRPDRYIILGEAYVPGLMYGEFFDTLPTPKPTWMEFH